MKKVVWSQLPIIWCISICMAKAKLSVSIMGNKPAVNATKRRKMAHGNVGPLTAKGLSLSNRLSKQVPSPCTQTQTACNQTKSASLLVRRTKKNALSWGSNRFELKCTWDKILNFQVTYLLFIVMARPKKKPLNGMRQTIAELAKYV